MAIKYFKMYSIYNSDRIVIIKIKIINNWIRYKFEISYLSYIILIIFYYIILIFEGKIN